MKTTTEKSEIAATDFQTLINFSSSKTIDEKLKQLLIRLEVEKMKAFLMETIDESQSDKEEIISNMLEKMQQFIAFEDTRLKVNYGTCEGCELGAKGFFLKGNNSGHESKIIFRINENGFFKTIQSCGAFKRI